MMKWHSFKFDNHQVDTYICDNMSETDIKYLDVEYEGEFIGRIAYRGFASPFQSEVEAFVDEYFSELALGYEV